MITLFTCKTTECPNKDVEYRVEDAPELVNCGGCQTPLTGTPEVTK
jgi:hypothetical protein